MGIRYKMTVVYYIKESVIILPSTVLFSTDYPYKLSKLPPIAKTGSLLALFLVWKRVEEVFFP